MDKRNLSPIVVYDGNFRCHNLYDVSPEFEGDIIVHGNVNLKTDMNFNGGIWVEGNISVTGNIEAEYIYASGYIEANDICAQDIQCNNVIICTNIVSAGNLECKVIDVTSICVANDFICRKSCYLHGDEFKVGGRFYCSNFISKYNDTIQAEPLSNYCE